MSKAEDFLASAKTAGWRGDLSIEGDYEIVVVQGSNAVLTQIWIKGNYSYPESSYTNGSGTTRRVRNAAEGLRIIEFGGFPKNRTVAALKDDVRNSRTVVTAGIRSKPRKTAPLDEEDDEPLSPLEARKSLPFHPGSSTQAILDAVRGRRVTWYNSTMRLEESAQIMDREDQRFLRVESNHAGRRVLVFASGDPQEPRLAGGGFRSIYIDMITRVTG